MNDFPYQPTPGETITDADPDEFPDYPEEDEEEERAEAERTRIENIPTLSISKLKELDDAEEEWLFIEAWNAKIRIRALSTHQVEQVRKRSRDKSGEIDHAKFQMNLVIAGVVEPHIDENAYRLLLGKRFDNVFQIIDRISLISGLKDTKKDQDKRERRFPRGQ